MVVTLAILGLPILAGPASASRDPFRPLVSSTTAPSSGSTTTSSSQTTAGGTSGSSSTTPAQPVDGTPNTGFDASEWLVLALTLILIGGGLFVIERLLRPARFLPERPSV